MLDDLKYQITTIFFTSFIYIWSKWLYVFLNPNHNTVKWERNLAFNIDSTLLFIYGFILVIYYFIIFIRRYLEAKNNIKNNKLIASITELSIVNRFKHTIYIIILILISSTLYILNNIAYEYSSKYLIENNYIWQIATITLIITLSLFLITYKTYRISQDFLKKQHN